MNAKLCLFTQMCADCLTLLVFVSIEFRKVVQVTQLGCLSPASYSTSFSSFFSHIIIKSLSMFKGCLFDTENNAFS